MNYREFGKTGEKISALALAFKFCLGNPNLSCALSGMQTLDMVKQNCELATADSGFSKAEWEELSAA